MEEVMEIKTREELKEQMLSNEGCPALFDVALQQMLCDDDLYCKGCRNCKFFKEEFESECKRLGL